MHHQLRRMLAELAMTQAEFASHLHVNPSTVCNWLSGECQIPHMAVLVLQDMHRRHFEELSRAESGDRHAAL